MRRLAQRYLAEQFSPHFFFTGSAPSLPPPWVTACYHQGKCSAEVLILSGPGWFLENTQPRRSSACLCRSANLSGGKKGESWSSSAGGKYLLSPRSFQRGSCRGEMASHLCSTLELICSAAFRSLTCPPPPAPARVFLMARRVKSGLRGAAS